MAARHRFFGQAPKKWGRKAAGGNDHRPRKRRTRTKHNDEAALSCAVTCAPFYLAIDCTGPARSTPFLCSCAKKRGGAPKKRAYGCRHGGCSVPPASPTDSKPQHHSRLRQADFAWPIYPPGISQLDAPIRPVGAYAQMGEAGGPIKVTWRLQKRFSLAARHRFFGQAPKKWGRTAVGAIDPHPT